MIFNILRYMFRPNYCYRKWYDITDTKEMIYDCKCLIKCKYTPPSTPSQIVYD